MQGPWQEAAIGPFSSFISTTRRNISAFLHACNRAQNRPAIALSAASGALDLATALRRLVRILHHARCPHQWHHSLVDRRRPSPRAFTSPTPLCFSQRPQRRARRRVAVDAPRVPQPFRRISLLRQPRGADQVAYAHAASAWEEEREIAEEVRASEQRLRPDQRPAPAPASRTLRLTG
jgi:hypothetical protein